ncbi:MAG: histidine kinase dimerization/phospho-acceptor domain-containing protein, partial [Chromatiaceae bacterium]
MTSIRRRLLILLLGSWTTVWVAVAVITLERSGHEVGELLDAQLAQTARVLCQITRAGNLPDLESLPQILSPLDHPYESKISFQLWRGDELISAFGGAPRGPLAETLGFSDRAIGDTKWRVYGLASGQPDERLFVAQSYAIRHELIEFLTIHAMQPILWSLPLTVLLIWLSVSDGLRPLRRLAGAIGKRSAERLTSIDNTSVPTEIRPLTDALNRLMEQLDQALAEERRFASDASHELRTPLAVIRTQAQVAKRSRDPAERTAALEGLIAGVDRATHLCSQLLLLARLDPEAADAVHPAASLADAVEQAVADKQALALSMSIEISQTLPQGDPCVVAVEPSALGILVGNLLDNAIKYSPEGGRVRISVMPRGGRVVLQLTDSGPGIPPADRGRVLE